MSKSISNVKNQYRNYYTSILKSFSPERRQEASENAYKTLTTKFNDFPHVLSFAPFQKEIDLSSLNFWLCKNNKLLLPKVNGTYLEIYSVSDLHEDLQISLFKIFEPNPSLCKQIPIDEISIALIPGLAFDHKKHRVGYGKGYYDRFLINLIDCPTYGIGYKEQLISKNEHIPAEEHDIPVSELILF